MRLPALARLGALLPALALVSAAAPAAAPQRIVSLNPSLTAILLALGAGGRLVGVDEYSARQQQAVRGLPTVGGLFTPSVESVVALEPDVVVLVPGAQQRDLSARLRELGIRVLELPNLGLDQLLGSIEALGALVGREAEAQGRVAAIRAELAHLERESAGRPRVRAVLVIQRDPLFVVGRGSFLHEMLVAAGADDLGAAFAEPYPRVDLEWLLAAAPEAILDASDEPPPAPAYWARWPSLPAVAAGRVVAIPGTEVVLPGPDVDRGAKILAAALRARSGRP